MSHFVSFGPRPHNWQGIWNYGGYFSTWSPPGWGDPNPVLAATDRQMAMHNSHTSEIVISTRLKEALIVILESHHSTNYMFGNKDHTWSQLAVLFATEEVALKWINRGIQDLAPSDRKTTLHIAAIKGSEKAVLRCLELAPSQKVARDAQSHTPYFYALQAGHLTLLKHLENGGESIDEKGEFGETPFLSACMRGDVAAATYCIERGANINSCLDNGDTALHIVATTGDVSMTNYLLPRYSPEARNKAGKTPTDVAYEEGKEGVWKLLNPDKPSPNFQKPMNLVDVIKTGNVERLKTLIGRGCDPNCLITLRDAWPTHLLVAATQTGQLECVRYLLSLPLDSDCKEEAYEYSLDGSHFEIFKLLFAAVKHNINQLIRKTNYTALEHFIRISNAESRFQHVEFLLAHNPDLNKGTPDTPLFQLIKKGDMKLAKLLADKGATLKDSEKKAIKENKHLAVQVRELGIRLEAPGESSENETCIVA